MKNSKKTNSSLYEKAIKSTIDQKALSDTNYSNLLPFFQISSAISEGNRNNNYQNISQRNLYSSKPNPSYTNNYSNVFQSSQNQLHKMNKTQFSKLNQNSCNPMFNKTMNKISRTVYSKSVMKNNNDNFAEYLPESKINLKPKDVINSLSSTSNYFNISNKNSSIGIINCTEFQINTNNNIKQNSSNYVNNLNKNHPIFSTSNQNYNFNDKENNSHCSNSNFKELEESYYNFKTNYILKFAKHPNYFNKLISLLDRVSDKNKSYLNQSLLKLKAVADKRDKILMNTEIIPSSNIEYEEYVRNNSQIWMDLMPLIFDYETLIINIVDSCVHEMRLLNDSTLQQVKKLQELKNLNEIKENEISFLNSYIKDNEINYKAIVINKKSDKIKDLQKEFSNKEKLNLIEKINLEEQIKELNDIIQTEKKSFAVTTDLKEEIFTREKEINDLKSKNNQEAEDKKMKISFLNNKINDLMSELEKQKEVIKKLSNNKEDTDKKEKMNLNINKFLNREIKQKDEIINMQKEELDTYHVMYVVEKENRESLSKQILMNQEKYTSKRLMSNINIGD